MRRGLLAILAVALLGVGCSGARSAKSEAPAPAERRSVYVAIGASETVGVGADDPAREAWTEVLFRTAMPRGTVFHNLGVSGSTVGQAVAAQLPAAVALRPTIATVWLNVNDLASVSAIDTYEQSLRTLVHGLRRDGATDVYVADTPPVESLPAVARVGLPTSLVTSVVDRFNAVITRVCADEGATVVHLHDAGVAALADGTFPSLISGDGFHPSTKGHAAIAAIFAAAIKARSSRPSAP